MTLTIFTALALKLAIVGLARNWVLSPSYGQRSFIKSTPSNKSAADGSTCHLCNTHKSLFETNDIGKSQAKLFFPILRSREWTRGRCYDHIFLPIFGEIIGVFLKTKCYDKMFAKNSSRLSKKWQFVLKKFGETIFKTTSSVPSLSGYW
jgi:hypothetical protein